MRRVQSAAVALFVALVFAPREASAQPVEDGTSAEWTYWLGAGGGYRKAYSGPTALDGRIGVFSVGAEFTVRLGTLANPSGYGGSYEWRLGPWTQTCLGSAFGLQEAGLILTFTQVDHAQWGTFDVRAGGGYGVVDGIAMPHLTLTASGGVRSFWGRYGNRRDLLKMLPAFGSVMRLYGTTRLRPELSSPWEVTFGLEVEPTFLLPPYSWGRLGGAHPW
ncbi:MAG: hypothetical protein HOW73_12310 [Polyangiaceae bacterium]|nr:hypothetical protein [Polyangiaceae bacterium]